MADVTAKDLAAKLRGEPFKRASGDVERLSDPIADTAMVVTIEELRPYDRNPRKTLNPRYEEIKASIRERGLDAPPAITRKPGEAHYIIRNGGNTRLAILGELWTETRDERFSKILCLFRPWTARGEIVALTGHLAENELRGNLLFIERAVGVDQARDLYEQEVGRPLSQRELAARLSADGYPVTQSHLSRMHDTIQYLLPAIPNLLYGGLGRPPIERLLAIRGLAAACWARHALGRELPLDFETFFQDVLSLFDGELETFQVQRVQDELIGQLCKHLGAQHLEVAVEFSGADRSQSVAHDVPISFAPLIENARPASERRDSSQGAEDSTRRSHSTVIAHSPGVPFDTGTRDAASKDVDQEAGAQHERVQAHIVSPAATTERLQAIQRTIAEATGEPVEDFNANVVRAIPVQAGGLHPISDVWYIEPASEAPERLRILIGQLAREIAQEAEIAEAIDCIDRGAGFICRAVAARSGAEQPSPFSRGLLSLLSGLSACQLKGFRSPIDGVRLGDDIGPLFEGVMIPGRTSQRSKRLSDEGFIKLVRLIRLVRRLVDLESAVTPLARKAEQ